jgi:hypothetical protein
VTLTIRTTVPRSAVTRANLVRATVNGLGFGMAGVEGKRPAAFLPPGATPSRGYAGSDPSPRRSDRDCQSHPSERAWQPTAKAVIAANPN